VSYALGIGLTNECNLSCAHCYRGLGNPRLTLRDLTTVLDSLDVGSVNLGTGENALHPDYHAMIDLLRAREVKLAMTSNGYSVKEMTDEELHDFHTVELSLDYATREEQDAFRGEGNWDLVVQCLERCRDLGVRTSVIAVMMKPNWDKLAAVAAVAATYGALFRVNVYQAVTTDEFTLNYEQFWEGFRRLFAVTKVVACSEPLVNAVMGLDTTRGSPCGTTSIRVSPRRQVAPCPYWPEKTLTLFDLRKLGGAVVDTPLFAKTRIVPGACRGCRFEQTCGGGCASRRALRGDLDKPDEYCPVLRGDVIDLPYTLANPEDLPKVGNACSTAVMGFAPAAVESSLDPTVVE